MARSENSNVARQVSMATRKELIEAVSSRYRGGSLKQRSAILDEFVAIAGYHRKHAIRLLSKLAAELQQRRPRVQYGADVRQALSILWEVSDRVCSKRLKVMIPALLPALIRHGRIGDDADLQAQLIAVSPATIDRLLQPMRLAAAKGRRRAAGRVRPSAAPCRSERSATGTIRLLATSRSTSSHTAGRTCPAASSRRWC
jgi:hypothetical protein